MLISCFLLVSFFILSIKINNGCGRRKARSGYLPRLGRSRKVCRSPAGVENRLLLRICANDDVTTNSCFKLVSKSSDFPWPNFLYGPTLRYIIPKKNGAKSQVPVVVATRAIGAVHDLRFTSVIYLFK